MFGDKTKTNKWTVELLTGNSVFQLKQMKYSPERAMSGS